MFRGCEGQQSRRAQSADVGVLEWGTQGIHPLGDYVSCIPSAMMEHKTSDVLSNCQLSLNCIARPHPLGG